jgi:hypothetical protein
LNAKAKGSRNERRSIALLEAAGYACTRAAASMPRCERCEIELAREPNHKQTPTHNGERTRAREGSRRFLSSHSEPHADCDSDVRDANRINPGKVSASRHHRQRGKQRGDPPPMQVSLVSLKKCQSKPPGRCCEYIAPGRGTNGPGAVEMGTLKLFPVPPNCRKLIHRWVDRRALPDVREL